MPEPSRPGAAAAAPASNGSVGLLPVRRDIDAIANQLSAGELRFDPAAARRLINTLNSTVTQLRDLLRESGVLAEPLRLGDNLMGRVMGDRLVQAAAGSGDAALSALGQYVDVLEDLATTISDAAGQYTATDDTAASDLRRIGATEPVEV